MKWFYRLFSIILICGALSLPFYADYKANGSFLNLQAFSDSAKSLVLKGKDLLSSSANVTSLIDSSPQSASTANIAVDIDQSIDQTATHQVSGSTVYRWQDNDGQWHFSDHPPETKSSKPVEAFKLNPEHLQTISAMDPALIRKQNENTQSTTPSTLNNLPSKTIDNTLSIDNAMNVIQNAQQAAAMMQQRNEALREVIGE